MSGKRQHVADCPILPPWTEELEKTARLYARGLSYAAIASERLLGRETVHKQLVQAREHMETCYRLELPGAVLRRHLVDVGCG